MATRGLAPPRICPVIIPGKVTIPTDAMFAKVGFTAALNFFAGMGEQPHTCPPQEISCKDSGSRFV